MWLFASEVSADYYITILSLIYSNNINYNIINIFITFCHNIKTCYRSHNKIDWHHLSNTYIENCKRIIIGRCARRRKFTPHTRPLTAVKELMLSVPAYWAYCSVGIKAFPPPTCQFNGRGNNNSSGSQLIAHAQMEINGWRSPSLQIVAGVCACAALFSHPILMTSSANNKCRPQSPDTWHILREYYPFSVK